MCIRLPSKLALASHRNDNAGVASLYQMDATGVWTKGANRLNPVLGGGTHLIWPTDKVRTKNQMI